MDPLWEMPSESVGLSKMQGNLKEHVPASSQGFLRIVEVENQEGCRGKGDRGK